MGKRGKIYENNRKESYVKRRKLNWFMPGKVRKRVIGCMALEIFSEQETLDHFCGECKLARLFEALN